MNFKALEETARCLEVLYEIADKKLKFYKDYEDFISHNEWTLKLLDGLSYNIMFTGKFDPRVKRMLMLYTGDKDMDFLSVEYLKDNASNLYNALRESSISVKNMIRKMSGKWPFHKVQDSWFICDQVVYKWKKWIEYLNELYELDIRINEIPFSPQGALKIRI